MSGMPWNRLAFLALSALLAAAALEMGISYTGYYIYTSGPSSGLGLWDSADPEYYQGNQTNAFIGEQARFYANYTNLTNYAPISGAGISCEIRFNLTGDWGQPASMSYNASSGLYEYNRSFANSGNFSWNVLCDGSAQGYGTLNATDNMTVRRYEWWNASWKYRLKLGVRAGAYEAVNWPVETDINFTDVLRQAGISATFDRNSTRVVEYNATGLPLHELPGQFDELAGYSASSNAFGTHVFILNGTTAAGALRTFFIYFDALENGVKALPAYTTNLSVAWSGDEVHFNNSRVEFYLDTNRTDNTSGIYSANFRGETQQFFYAGEDARTVEYAEFSNSTHNLTFDFAGNASFTEGPVRLTMTQTGDEVPFGVPGQATGEGRMTRRYYVYEAAGPQLTGTWIKVEQDYTNIAAYQVERNSTPGGALAYDFGRGLAWIGSTLPDYNYLGNATDPFSWYLALSDNLEILGLVSLNESIQQFVVTNVTAVQRLGVQLDSVTMGAGSSAVSKAAVYMGRGNSDEFIAIKNTMRSQPSAAPGLFEARLAESYVTTDHDAYNRNETVVITVNVTYEPYGLLGHVNLSLTNGTSDPSDDINFSMRDDGQGGDATANDSVFTTVYNFSLHATPGTWNSTATLFTPDGRFLNTSVRSFTVTAALSVTVTIHNPDGLINTFRNATVRVLNYRQDTPQPSAESMNCTVFYGSSPVFDISPQNVTDKGDGNYTVNFTAPSYFGSFTLNCTAVKRGNSGSGTDTFTTEDIATNISVAVDPMNFSAAYVTWTANQSFLANVNATNTQNATAYNATIGLGLPASMRSNATTYFCGQKNLSISKSCFVTFNLTVLNTTSPGNYIVNFTLAWNNSNQVPGSNSTYLNVTVLPTYVLDILEGNVSGVVAAGKKKNFANFTVRSLGNSPLLGANFSVSGFPAEFNFTFDPPNVSQIAAGSGSSIKAFLEVSAGYPSGKYSGTLNATSQNGGYELLEVNITVSGTNMTLEASPLNYTAALVTYLKGENFSVYFNSTNLGNATAFAVNFTLNSTTSYIHTTNSTPVQCGNIEPAGNCSGSLHIVISNSTPSGNYPLNLSVRWQNPEIGILSNWTLINVTVTSSVNFTIPEDAVSGNITHGTTAALGNFSVNSTGNDPVAGVQVRIEDPGQQLRSFFINATPNLTALSAGQYNIVYINVTVPLSYPPGIYSGYINITSSSAGYRQLNLNVTVPESRTWLLQSPPSQYCEHSESPESGTICNVTLDNTGNVPITFNITPKTNATSMFNNTWTDYVDFVLQNQTKMNFSAMYNVTGQPVIFYYANYTISAVQGTPASRNLSLVLNPFINPILAINMSSVQIQEGGNLEITAEVDSQSGIPMDFSSANVTRPDNTTDAIKMRRVGTGTDPYTYIIGYPTDSVNGTWGNSTLRGNYSVKIYAQDNMGLNSTGAASFYSYAQFRISMAPARSSGQYYQGESGTVSFRARDAAGWPIEGANVSIAIKDQTGRSLLVTDGDFMTGAEGEPPGYPNFQLFSDSATGLYNITATCSFNETPISMMVYATAYSNFTVLEWLPGLVLLDLEAPAQSSVTDGLDVVAMITDGASSTDPDTIAVSLYDSLDNLILQNVSMTRLSTGRYAGWYNTSVSSNQGNWRWVVSITKGTKSVIKDVFTRLVGGPFDARNVTVTDNEVPDLRVTVIIENTGDVGQDAVVVWNLTRTDTGAFLTSGMDTVLVPGNSEYTYVALPAGVTYIGEVKITFIVTYSGTEKAGAYGIFSTVEQAAPKPPKPPSGPGGGGEAPPPAGGGGIGPAPAPKLEIVEYPEETATEAGWKQYPSVIVNNSGNAVLHNVMVYIAGIPSSWYTVQPPVLPILRPGETKSFVINIEVPIGAEAKQYYGTLNATSNETYDEKMISVIVFGSREELVRYQLRKLKEEFDDFRDDVNATAKEGTKDLTRVYDIIGEIQHQIDLIEEYLDSRLFDDALDSVTTGWRLLERGRELLRTAPPVKPVTMLEIPDWMIMAILLLVILALALVILFNRYRKKLRKAFRREVPEARAAAEMTRAVPAGPQAFGEERKAAAKAEEIEKVRKVLALLEKEYKEGVISVKAYEDLKRRNEEKLRQLQG